MKGFLVILLYHCLHGFISTQEPQKMSFSSPNLSEEEMHSSHMPDNLKCDACSAVAYQMTAALNKAEMNKGNKKLLESEYLDVFEKVCQSSTFESYGLKSVNGMNRLSGKGLEADSIPGMLMGGGKWPGRLASKCFEFIDERGEDDIYDRLRKKRNLKEYLCRQVTSDCFVGTKKKKKKQEL